MNRRKYVVETTEALTVLEHDSRRTIAERIAAALEIERRKTL